MAQRLRRVTDNQIDELLAEQARLGKCLRSNPSILHALLTRRRKGVVVSPKNGMFASRDLWESLDVRQRHLFVARTIADRCPDDLFCYVTAAFAYGLDFTITGAFGTDVKTVCISGKGGANGCSSAGLRRFKLEADGAWTAEGLRVSSPEKTVFDCARGLAFPDGLAIADSALRLGLLDPDSLRRLIDSGGNRKGIGKARDVFEHMNGLAENGGESVLRARMIELGYAEPKLQVTFDNPLEPTKPYRVDLLSIRTDGTMVAIELDGRRKYTDAEFMNGKDTVEVLLDERQREAALSSLGLEIMRIRWPDLLDSAKLSSIMNAYRIPTARQLGH